MGKLGTLDTSDSSVADIIITNGTPITSFTEGLTTYSYNNLKQLLSATPPIPPSLIGEGMGTVIV